jgi:hypothetical protein
MSGNRKPDGYIKKIKCTFCFLIIGLLIAVAVSIIAHVQITDINNRDVNLVQVERDVRNDQEVNKNPWCFVL